MNIQTWNYALCQHTNDTGKIAPRQKRKSAIRKSLRVPSLCGILEVVEDAYSDNLATAARWSSGQPGKARTMAALTLTA
jgi:hypothetical protein